MSIARWMNLALVLGSISALAACATSSGSQTAETGWTARVDSRVNPHLRLLEGQTRGATEARCVPGPTWSSDVPEERRLKPRVEILEFTDFECPYCGRAQRTLERILDYFGPCSIRITTIPKPLPMHSGARDAALVAARAAQEGPEAHERIHRELFDSGEGLTPDHLVALAKTAGLSEAAVAQALEDPTLGAFVDWAVFVGDHAEARGTPTFFVNGHLMLGAQPFETFSEIIEGELKFSRDREGRWGDRWLSGRLALNAPVLYALLLEGRRLEELPESEDAAAQDTGDESETPRELKVQDVDVRETDPIRGKLTAPVTIVTFSDFECPYCSRLHETLVEVAAYYGERVRFVSKQYPLPFHKQARGAAKAALCAHDQGAYWPFHDALHQTPETFSDGMFQKLAKKLKLNLKKFKRCRANKETDRRVDSDMMQATDLGVSGTPVSFVNGFQIGGAMPFSHFKALIDAALGPKAKQ